MIEGLKIRITSEELQKHCQERSKYHTDRAAQKQGELPGLKEALDKIKASGMKAAESMASMGGKGSYHLDTSDPIEDLEKDIRDHQNKAIVFSFFAGHLFDEVYVLQEADLTRLEILKRW